MGAGARFPQSSWWEMRSLNEASSRDRKEVETWNMIRMLADAWWSLRKENPVPYAQPRRAQRWPTPHCLPESLRTLPSRRHSSFLCPSMWLTTYILSSARLFPPQRLLWMSPTSDLNPLFPQDSRHNFAVSSYLRNYLLFKIFQKDSCLFRQNEIIQ